MAQLYMVKAIHPLTGVVGGHLLVKNYNDLSGDEQRLVDFYHDSYIYAEHSIRIPYNGLMSISLDKFEVTMTEVAEQDLTVFEQFDIRCGGIAIDLMDGLKAAEERGELMWGLGYHMC